MQSLKTCGSVLAPCHNAKEKTRLETHQSPNGTTGQQRNTQNPLRSIHQKSKTEATMKILPTTESLLQLRYKTPWADSSKTEP